MIDLHLHSLCSDGELSPSAVVKKAQKENISTISLTDHDSIDGLFKAGETAKKLGISFIPGVELEASTENINSLYIHILGYNFQKLDLLEQYLSSLKKERLSLINQYVDLLNSLGFATSLDDISSLNPGNHITVYHVAIFLSKKGYFDFKTAKKLFLNPDGKYYIPRHFYSTVFIINLILRSGGIPVLAHPCRLRQKGKDLDIFLAKLCSQGLQGIETYYSSHSQEEMDFYHSLAQKYHLLETAGSDWHSPYENIKMGISINSEKEIVFQLLNNNIIEGV